jgi:hypothetical protein
MVEDKKDTTRGEFRGARFRIFGTDPDNPEDGRIFVWTKMGWFERVQGSSGNVAFIHVAQSENELRELISRDDPSIDFVSLGGEYRKRVSDEFMEQSLSSRDSEDSENSTEEASEDSEDNDQQYHQHGL